MQKKFFVLFFLSFSILASCGTQVPPVENIETPVPQTPIPSESISSETEENNNLGYDYAYSYIDREEMEAYAQENNLAENWRDLDRIGAPFQFENTKIFRFSDKTSIDLNGDFGNLGLSPSGTQIAFDKFDRDQGENSNTYVYNISEDTKVLQNFSKDFRNSLEWIDENTFGLYDFFDETRKISSSGDIESYSGSIKWFADGNYIQSSQDSDGKISYYSQNGDILAESNIKELGVCNKQEWYHSIHVTTPQLIVTSCDDASIFGYDLQDKSLKFKINPSQAPFSSLSSEYSFMDYRTTKDTMIIRFDKRSETGGGKGESVFFMYNIETKTFAAPLYEKDFITTARIVK